MANERRRGMGGPRGGQMPVEKAKDFKGSIGKLFSYMKRFHGAIVVVMLCAVASTVFIVIIIHNMNTNTTPAFQILFNIFVFPLFRQ